MSPQKILFLLSLLLITNFTTAQTTTQNYVQTLTARDTISGALIHEQNYPQMVQTDVVYVDGHEEAHASRFDAGEVSKIDNSNIDFLNDSPEEITNKLNENLEQHLINEEKEASHVENIIRAEYDPKQKRFGLRKVYSNIPKSRVVNGVPTISTHPPVNVIKDGYRYYKKKGN
ncbi:MAG: hypothetical protein R8G66_17620 [Cytophagales bacterium]|nr:hypothetical protein [Cytophagales bacterium]